MMSDKNTSYEEAQSLIALSSPANINKYFQIYITEVLHLSSTSAHNYLRSLKKLSECMKQLELIKDSIYEIGSIEQLDSIWKDLKDDKTFSALNSRGHRMYSAGFSRYRDFASGVLFKGMVDSDIHKLDIPMVCESPVMMEYKVWKRSGILRSQTVALADYKCDMDCNHSTFITASNNKPYMEAHHIIPIRLQGSFKNSLDVYANLVSLCPLCHRKIHLGIMEERRQMIDTLYERRMTRLANCGLSIGKIEFEDMILAL